MVILTKLKKEDFEKILNNYEIGKYKNHKHLDWALSNTVYEIKTTKGKFILKIFEHSDPKFINYQIKIIDFLSEKKIPVAKISQLKNGKEILIYRTKRILIQKFIPGTTPKRLNDKLLKNLARNFSMMSKNLLNLKLKEKYDWGKDHQFESESPKRKIGNILGFNFREHEKKLLIELSTLQKKKLRRSITHGDFHGANLLIKNSKLNAIIDFDDAHEDYLSNEIAVFMIDPFVKQNSFNKKQAKIFLKEYQKQLKLNTEEKKAIYYFIKDRLLGMILWFVKQLPNHKDHKKRLIKNLNTTISKYQAFDKFPLEEFLKLF